MKLTVTGRHLDISEAARRQIETKLGRLDRLLHDRATAAQCVLSQQRGVHVCELTVQVSGGHPMPGLGRGASLQQAVSAAVGKVAQQAQRLKGRSKTRRRSALETGGRAAGRQELASNESTPRVIRSRSAVVKPMGLDDAVLELAEGHQNFVVFRDAESDNVAILYRRPDGHFGLIEPGA